MVPALLDPSHGTAEQVGEAHVNSETRGGGSCSEQASTERGWGRMRPCSLLSHRAPCPEKGIY